MVKNKTFREKNTYTEAPQSKKMLLGIVILMSILCVNIVSAITWDNTGYYKMDENAGINVGDAVNSIDGTLSGFT